MLFKKLFIDFFHENKKLMIIHFIIILLIFPVESIILSRLFGDLFEKIKIDKPKGSFLDYYDNIKKLNAPGIIVIIIFIWLIVSFLYFTKNYLESIILPRYILYVRNLLFGNLIKRYSYDYKEMKSGEVISRIMLIANDILDLYQDVVINIMPTFIGIFIINIYFYFLDIQIGFLYSLGIIIIILIYYYNLPLFVQDSKSKQDLIFDNSEKLNDSMNNLLNVYLNNEEDKEINKNKKYESIFSKSYIKSLWGQRKLTFSSEFTIIVISSIIMLFSYFKLKKGSLSIVNFISILIILSYAMKYLMNINEEISTGIALYGQLQSSQSFIHDLLDLQIYNKKKNCIHNGEIMIQNLYYSYNNNQNNVINNLNLRIKDKEKIAIVGSSGSGKSTLMKLLIGLYKTQYGTISIGGHDIKSIDLYYLRQKIIYVNQRTNLFNYSIIDNIKYGNPHVQDIHIKQLISKYDLHHIYNNLPRKIYSNCGVNGSNLSLGMQKITIILRSLFKKGQIYIFDEPLAGLDALTKERVIEMILTELHDKTIIVITHDSEILPKLNRIINLKDINNN